VSGLVAISWAPQSSLYKLQIITEGWVPINAKILEDVKEAVEEMKLIKEGKLKDLKIVYTPNEL